MIRPLLSHTGMKSSGITRPRSGERQRSSASAPTTRRVCTHTRGW